MVAEAKGATVLVADDDDGVRGFVASVLRAEGYLVLEAATGDAALELWSARPDLLIADLVMPPLGGMELANALRARLPGIAVLHISGYATRAFNDDLTVTELIGKPFTAAELLGRVEALLGNRRGA